MRSAGSKIRKIKLLLRGKHQSPLKSSFVSIQLAHFLEGGSALGGGRGVAAPGAKVRGPLLLHTRLSNPRPHSGQAAASSTCLKMRASDHQSLSRTNEQNVRRSHLIQELPNVAKCAVCEFLPLLQHIRVRFNFHVLCCNTNKS